MNLLTGGKTISFRVLTTFPAGIVIITQDTVINLTGGIHVEMGRCTTMTFAAGVPLRDKDGDDLYDAELQLQVNRRY